MGNILKDMPTENTSSKKKEYTKWKKSNTIGDDTKSIEVRECENGFIIREEHSYKSDDGWKYDEKEYISKTNPLENDGDVTTKPSIKDLVGNLDNNFLSA